MPSQRVLVCGAGVAGSVTAYWLAKYDFEVVVVERAGAEQKAGQGLEIEDPALEVVKAMGVFDKLKAKRTGELGFELVDEHSRPCGSLEIGSAFSATGALEMMRGDMTEIFYKAADESPNVSFHFQTTVQSLRQTPDKVIVDLENRVTKATRTEEFDFVIGADGVKSRTRQLVMGSTEQLNCVKPVGAFVAFFSIPKTDRDWPYAKMCHFPNRRIIWIRPMGKDSDFVSVYLIYCHDDLPALHEAVVTGDRLKQKQGLAELYSGLGWETPRVIEGMMKSDNFYCDELAQIKLKSWSKDRVALVGDSAWAPTPFTGEGSHLAIIGAFVLAQEMSRNRSPAAFENYDKRFRSYVENAQNIPLYGYAPYIFNPQTAWGIWLFRKAFGLLVWVVKFMSWSKKSSEGADKGHEPFDLQMEEVLAKTGA